MSETDKVTVKAQSIAELYLKTLGLVLYDLEYKRENTGMVLRIFIDKPEGSGKINISDCQQVSHVLSMVFEEQNLIEGRYNLEVSSPGLDRVLKMEKDFVKFAGFKANIYFNGLVNGKNNLTGLIKGVNSGKVLFEVDGKIVVFPVGSVKKGKLILSL